MPDTRTYADPDHVFFVTGAASGIGRRLAERLVETGRRVMATDLRLEPLREVAVAAGWPDDRVRVSALDVRDPAAWERALDEAVAAFGWIDVLMNVAGYLKPGWAIEADPAEVGRHFDVNALGVIHGTSAAARRMVGRGGGHVVNIASMAALAPVPGLSLYCASKYAVRGFSIAAAQELRPRGVYVSVVCPDAVATPMLDVQKNDAAAALTFSAPRILSADDVCDVVLGEVLAKRPLEVAIPPSRGWLARAANLFPEAGLALAPLLRRQGRARQKRMSET